MTELSALIKRNCKLFFKDKGMFFTSLITPLILLVLYATFLGKVYKDAFAMSIPEGFSISEKLLNSAVGSQLMASLLAVCSVTVAFCSNLLMVQDKISGARRDLDVTPVKKSTLAIGYFAASAISTLIICFIALFACFIYIGLNGWYFSFIDVIAIVLDIIMLVLFGTALSSVIHFPLTTQGQASAIGTIVSSGYGFICGAYMPISNFGVGLQRILSFLPGTYGTALLKSHAMRGTFDAMVKEGVPSEVVSSISKAVDCRVEFFDKEVLEPGMYVVLISSILLLIGIYVLLNVKKKARK